MGIRYIFNTSGDYVAFTQGNNLFTPDCKWVGFILNGNEVFNTSGLEVGHLLDDDRIVTEANVTIRKSAIKPLSPLIPLRPLKPLKRLKMPKLPYPYIDLFLDKLTFEKYFMFRSINTTNFKRLLGGKIIATDQTFLGTINSSKYENDSILNKYGPYGSQYEHNSIFNKYGDYGSKYSQLSPFNSYSTTPPSIIKDGHVLGYLTANKHIQNRIDVDDFISWLDSLK